jgi:hypothetical protein
MLYITMLYIIQVIRSLGLDQDGVRCETFSFDF